MFKLDIKSVFRLLSLNPEGFNFRKQYIYKCMHFGCSIHCATFENNAQSIEFAVQWRFVASVRKLKYLTSYCTLLKACDRNKTSSVYRQIYFRDQLLGRWSFNG